MQIFIRRKWFIKPMENQKIKDASIENATDRKEMHTPSRIHESLDKNL